MEEREAQPTEENPVYKRIRAMGILSENDAFAQAFINYIGSPYVEGREHFFKDIQSIDITLRLLPIKWIERCLERFLTIPRSAEDSTPQQPALIALRYIAFAKGYFTADEVHVGFMELEKDLYNEEEEKFLSDFITYIASANDLTLNGLWNRSKRRFTKDPKHIHVTDEVKLIEDKMKAASGKDDPESKAKIENLCRQLNFLQQVIGYYEFLYKDLCKKINNPDGSASEQDNIVSKQYDAIFLYVQQHRESLGNVYRRWRPKSPTVSPTPSLADLADLPRTVPEEEDDDDFLASLGINPFAENKTPPAMSRSLFGEEEEDLTFFCPSTAKDVIESEAEKIEEREEEREKQVNTSFDFQRPNNLTPLTFWEKHFVLKISLQTFGISLFATSVTFAVLTGVVVVIGWTFPVTVPFFLMVLTVGIGIKTIFSPLLTVAILTGIYAGLGTLMVSLFSTIAAAMFSSCRGKSSSTYARLEKDYFLKLNTLDSAEYKREPDCWSHCWNFLNGKRKKVEIRDIEMQERVLESPKGGFLS